MRNTAQVIPNFIGIGAPKCATTWLSEVLARHPEIFMAHGKELVYFSSEKKIDRGIDWYLKHFSGVTNEKAIGEFSVTYMGAGEITAKRIYDFNPNIKLIAVLRDPVKRAFSHYRWLIQVGKHMPKSFFVALKQHPYIINDSLYFKNLKPFFELFPEKNLLFIKYEDIKMNERDIQDKVFQFLTVDQNIGYSLVDKNIGKTITPKFQALEKMRIKIHKFLKRNNMASIITLMKRLGLSNLYRQLNDTAELNKLSDEEYQKAIPYFKDDVIKLKEKMPFSVDDWLVN